MDITEKRLNRISEFVDCDHYVVVMCRGCRHAVRLDFKKILENYGDIEFDEYKALLPSFTCSQCGERNAKFEGRSGHLQPMGWAGIYE